MIEEFDKETDILLRQTARNEKSSRDSKSKFEDLKSAHLDADEISAFAENALPEKAGLRLIAHFADCDRCRKILSNVIQLSAENESVSAREIEKVFAPTIPWYRKFLLFPNVAYTLGALVLVFSGLAAFILLKSVDNSQNLEISQVAEQTRKGGPFSDDAPSAAEENANLTTASSSMSNVSMSNSAAVSSSNSSTMASTNTTTANAAAKPVARAANSGSTANSSNAQTSPIAQGNEFSKDAADNAAAATQNSISELPLAGRAIENLSELKRESAKKEDKERAETTNDTAKSAPAPKSKSDQRTASENQVLSDSTSLAKKKAAAQNVETTSVNGKNFERKDNVWIDSAYKNQTLVNISRGTKDYKKLDSDLRKIIENLGGTITIVWKDKAYRIQ